MAHPHGMSPQIRTITKNANLIAGLIIKNLRSNKFCSNKSLTYSRERTQEYMDTFTCTRVSIHLHTVNCVGSYFPKRCSESNEYYTISNLCVRVFFFQIPNCLSVKYTTQDSGLITTIKKT